MQQVTITGRDGQRRIATIGRDDDLNDILQDGETLSFPLTFMDALISQRGYLQFADDAVADADRQKVEDARAEMIDRVSNRWKHAATVKPIPHQDGGAGATPEAALAAYQDRLTNAWRKPR
jgi:hypothetical protein